MPGLPDASYTYRRWSGVGEIAPGGDRVVLGGIDDDVRTEGARRSRGAPPTGRTPRSGGCRARPGPRPQPSPTGPQPVTIAPAGGSILERHTPLRPVASGSTAAASYGRDAVGDRHVPVRRHHHPLGQRAGVVGGVPDAVHDPVGIDDRG